MAIGLVTKVRVSVTALDACAASALACRIQGRLERCVALAVGPCIGSAEAVGARVVNDNGVVVDRVVQPG